jgi:hypothetical protein
MPSARLPGLLLLAATALLLAIPATSLSVLINSKLVPCGGTSTVCSVLPSCAVSLEALANSTCLALGQGFGLCTRAQVQALAGVNVTSPIGKCPGSSTTLTTWLQNPCPLGSGFGRRTALIASGLNGNCIRPDTNQLVGMCCTLVANLVPTSSPTSTDVPSVMPTAATALPTSSRPVPQPTAATALPASSRPVSQPTAHGSAPPTLSPTSNPSAAAGATSAPLPQAQAPTPGPQTPVPVPSQSPTGAETAPAAASNSSSCNSTCQGLAATLALCLFAAGLGLVWLYRDRQTKQAWPEAKPVLQEGDGRAAPRAAAPPAPAPAPPAARATASSDALVAAASQVAQLEERLAMLSKQNADLVQAEAQLRSEVEYLSALDKN